MIYHLTCEIRGEFSAVISHQTQVNQQFISAYTNELGIIELLVSINRKGVTWLASLLVENSLFSFGAKQIQVLSTKLDSCFQHTALQHALQQAHSPPVLMLTVLPSVFWPPLPPPIVQH